MAAGSNEVRNPKSGSEINNVWLEYILTRYERRRDPEVLVRVINYEVKPGTKPGENVGSELMKIWVEATLTGRRKEEEEKKKKKEEPQASSSMKEEEKEGREQSNSTTTKEYHLMAKFNTGTEFQREYMKHLNMDLNELLMYSHVLPQLNTWQEKVLREREGEGPGTDRYKVLVPEYVYGACKDADFVLVMQDVSALGFTTLDKMQGMGLPHVLMAADHLARLHAVSYAFNQTQDFLKQYPSFAMEKKVSELHINFTFAIYDGAVEMTQGRPELGPLAEKLVENRNFLMEKMKKVSGREDPKNRVVCLTHGDYWTNNLMYSHGESTDGRTPPPEDLMIIDWALLNWRNPIVDLQQLVYNCTTLSLRRRHLQEILTYYHSTFMAATSALGAPVEDYGPEEFMKEWRRISVFGFVQCGVFANTIVLSHKANQFFQKGSLSSGLKSVVLSAMGKVFTPLILNGWLGSFFVRSTKKRLRPVFDEIASGENPVQTARVLEIMMEAYESGVLDQ